LRARQDDRGRARRPRFTNEAEIFDYGVLSAAFELPGNQGDGLELENLTEQELKLYHIALDGWSPDSLTDMCITVLAHIWPEVSTGRRLREDTAGGSDVPWLHQRVLAQTTRRERILSSDTDDLACRNHLSNRARPLAATSALVAHRLSRQQQTGLLVCPISGM
jgi:hypothetical protein